MIVSPCVITFIEGLMGSGTAERSALDRITGRSGFLPRRKSVEEACFELYHADDSKLKDLGLTRQHVLRMMSEQFGH
jgi:hypothetical protein